MVATPNDTDPLTPSPLSGPVDECAALRALCDAATPGPWTWRVSTDRRWCLVYADQRKEPIGRLVDDDTADFIAASRTAVPSLLARLAEARAQLAEARQRIMERQDIIADWMNAAGDARRRAAAAEALALRSADELDSIAKTDGGNHSEITWDEAALISDVADRLRALAVSPPEPEADEPDDLGQFIAEQGKDPAFAGAYEDAQARARIIDALLVARRSGGLTQAVVAERMGVKQPMISEFENESSDPRLSTLQRYARAVGGAIRIDFAAPPPVDQPKCEHGQTEAHDMFMAHLWPPPARPVRCPGPVPAAAPEER